MFALNDWTAARVESATPRIESHGKSKLVAISLGLKIVGTNLLLDCLSPTLRDGLYRAAEGQEDLPGVDKITPHLRAPDIAGTSLSLERVRALEGATVYFDHGIEGEGAPITMTLSKVDRFRVVPFDGGSVALYLRIGSSDVDDAEIGHLCGKLGSETRIRIEPATEVESVQTGQTIDGTQGHPGAGPLFDEPGEDEPDATDTFVAAHSESAKKGRGRKSAGAEA